MQNLNLTFNPGAPVVGGGGVKAAIPSDASIAHNWKDVLGVRLGADVAVVPNVLSLRTGGFFESKGVDDKYLNIDFDLAQKIGVSGGLTVRLGPVDTSIAYAHTFFGTLDNGGVGGVYLLLAGAPAIRRLLHRQHGPDDHQRLPGLLPELPGRQRRQPQGEPERVRPRGHRPLLIESVPADLTLVSTCNG